jgi:pimeloyl-ACP methyl ester carboxylesterase
MTGGEVLLSASPFVDSAVVFVHGWGGAAGRTWENFQAGLRGLPEASKADGIFWGYPSTIRKVAFCAAKFREFLGDLVEAPASHILNLSLPPKAPPRDPQFRYRKVVLCAHSMGAVIVRRAVIELDRMGKLEASRTAVRLLLFAPAHKGSNIPMMAASGFGLEWIPGARLIANSLLVLRYRSLMDLATGSEVLRLLEQDCRDLRTSKIPEYERILESRRRLSSDADVEAIGASLWGHLRATVLHAEADGVVEQERFDDDPPFTTVMRRNHRSICKPDDSYRKPVEELQKLI